MPGSAKMIYVLKRHFPWLVDYVMDREIRKLRKGKAAS